MKDMDVAILIVTYNSQRQICECLRSVFAERLSVTQQVIVLDNASQDETVRLVREHFPEAELLTPNKNLGFAAGVNLAARHARGNYLLLLNPDTVILDHAVDVVVNFARAHPGHGLYGGRTLKLDGSLEPSSCWGQPSLWSMTLFAAGLTTLAPRNRWLDPESLGGWQRDTVREIGVVTGCFLLAERAAWEQLGGLDERYFMYGEDTDLSARARKAGYRPLFCPDARLVHEVGQSSTSSDKILMLYRGKASYVRAHWHGWKRRFGLTMLLAGVALRRFLARLGFSGPAGHTYKRWNILWEQRQQWIQGYGT